MASSYPMRTINVSSQEDLDREMKRVIQLFSKNKESEDTWQKFEQALRNITVWTVQDKAHRYETFAAHLRALKRPIIQSLTTERTRLSKTAFELLQSLAQTMQREYEPLHEMFGPTLVKLFARTNKVQLQRARSCYTHLIDHAKLAKSVPSLCALLKKGVEQNKAVRHGAASCLEHILVVNDPHDLKPYLAALATAIRQAATDSSPDVRAAIRACFQAYAHTFPDHCASFQDTLTPTEKKYLHVDTAPPASSASSSHPSSQSSAKSSRPAASLSSSSSSSSSIAKRNGMTPSSLLPRRSTTLVKPVRPISKKANTPKAHTSTPAPRSAIASKPAKPSSSASTKSLSATGGKSNASANASRLSVIEKTTISRRLKMPFVAGVHKQVVRPIKRPLPATKDEENKRPVKRQA